MKLSDFEAIESLSDSSEWKTLDTSNNRIKFAKINTDLQCTIYCDQEITMIIVDDFGDIHISVSCVHSTLLDQSAMELLPNAIQIKIKELAEAGR